MKKIQEEPKDEQTINILKRVAKRVEDATVDIHEMKRDLKFVNLRLGQVEDNTAIMKVDMEKMRNEMDEMKIDMGTMKKDIKDIKRSADNLMEITAEILKKAATREEVNDLCQRVAILEQTP